MRLIAALLAAAGLALLDLADLAGAAYATHAARLLDRPAAPATLEAARLAARSAPWSATRVALHGWVLAEREAPESLAAYAAALRLAPADPLLWTEYALALARLGRFGPEATLAAVRARQLAPASPAVRRSLAELGLSYWQRGAPEQRELWLEAMREELARNRAAFLRHVLTRGQGRTFCADAGARLGEQAWCEAAARAVAEGCFEDTPAGPVPCRVAP